jgi:hypothetical protein
MPSKEEIIQEMGLARDLWKRGRLKILPERSRAAGEIRRIVKRYGRKGVAP